MVDPVSCQCRRSGYGPGPRALKDNRVSLRAMGASPPWTGVGFTSLYLCFPVCAMGQHVSRPHGDTWTALSTHRAKLTHSPSETPGRGGCPRAIPLGRHQAQVSKFPRINPLLRAGTGSSAGLPSPRARTRSAFPEREQRASTWQPDVDTLCTLACAWHTCAWTQVSCPPGTWGNLGARETWWVGTITASRGGWAVGGHMSAWGWCGPPGDPRAGLLRPGPLHSGFWPGRALSPRGQAVPWAAIC